MKQLIAIVGNKKYFSDSFNSISACPLGDVYESKTRKIDFNCNIKYNMTSEYQIETIPKLKQYVKQGKCN